MKEPEKNSGNSLSFCGISRSRVYGFTFIELVSVIVILSTLVTVLLVRILPAIDEAETASVLKLEGQLRSALALSAAEKVAAGNYQGIYAMRAMNPMELMLDVPSNYLGSVDEENANVPGGSWYFAEESSQLRYRPEEPTSGRYRDRPVEELGFAVETVFSDDGRKIYGVRLVRTSGEEWLTWVSPKN